MNLKKALHSSYCTLYHMSSPKSSLYAVNVYDYDFNALKKKLLCETILDAVNDTRWPGIVYIVLRYILPGKISNQTRPFKGILSLLLNL